MEHATDDAVVKLLNTLFFSANLEQLVNCSIDIVKNPIVVYDAGYFCIAQSDTRGIDDPFWVLGKVGSNCLYEFATILSHLGTKLLQDSGSRELLYYDIENFSTHRRRIIPLVFSDELLGFLIVLELRHPLDDIPEADYRIVAGAMVKELSAEQKMLNYRRGDTQKKVILDLMQGNFNSRDIFQLRLRSLKITGKSTYCIISANMSDFHLESRYNYLEALLESIFPRAWTVLMQNHFLLLVDCALAAQLPGESLENLKSVMAATGLQAGVSDFFSDLFKAPQYWQQAILAAGMAKKLGHHSPVVFFDSYKLWLCVDSLSPQSRGAYISTLVKKMHEHDVANGSQYVETLYHYLSSGKSLIKTGEALHLHRNTIVYRLERMKALFGLESGESYDDLQNYLSCMLLILSEIESGEQEA